MAVPRHDPALEDEMAAMTSSAEVGVNMFSVFMSGDCSLSDSQLIGQSPNIFGLTKYFFLLLTRYFSYEIIVFRHVPHCV